MSARPPSGAPCAITGQPFALHGRIHLRLLVDSGPPADLMARHLMALQEAAQAARLHLGKVTCC